MFRSGDRGTSWREIAVVEGQYWSTLFLHRDGAVYLLGTSADGFVAEAGIAISRSVDGGFTWHNKVDLIPVFPTSTSLHACARIPPPPPPPPPR